MRIRKKEASLVELKEPQFMSLVKDPSNRSGFKVVRSEKEKRSGLVSITLPDGISREDALSYMDTFDLGDEFSLYERDGKFYVSRAEDVGDDVTTVDIGNGLMASISNEAFTPVNRQDDELSGVVVTNIVFDKKTHTRASASKWLEDFAIDCKLDDDMESSKRFVAVRNDEYQDLPKTIEVGEGVTVSVVRAEESDIPVKLYRHVAEAAYGSWGWGHIDFTMALADPEFTNKSWDAIYILRDVLENIMFYSGLPIEDRKKLLQNALASFASYMFGLMDSLPTLVAEQARSEKREIKDMPKAKDDAAKAEDKTTEAKRSEQEGKEADAITTETETENEQDDDKVTVSRNELADLISKGVEAALAAREDGESAEVKDSKEGGKEAEQAARSDEDGKEPQKDEGEDVSELAKVLRSVGETLKSVQDEIKELKGSSVTTRSDAEEEEEPAGEKKQRSVFDGVIFGKQARK